MAMTRYESLFEMGIDLIWEIRFVLLLGPGGESVKHFLPNVPFWHPWKQKTKRFSEKTKGNIGLSNKDFYI